MGTRKLFLSVIAVGASLASLVSLAKDDAVLKDPPRVTRMPNYEAIDGDNLVFDSTKFCVAKGEVAVEGRVYRRQYQIKEGAQKASDLQILRNFSNAIRASGGQVLLEGDPPANCSVEMCGKTMTGQIKQGAIEAWISVVPCNEGYDYTVWVVEKQAMVQEVTANAMFDALNRDGHIALYINFDTGKSTVRQDSKGTIAQIVQLLKGNPNLKVAIEGHTDNVGNAPSNKALSDARAKAVLAGVVEAGIDAARLNAAGYGADRPIADNRDEAGRAKNRRVELVKR